MTVLFVSTHMIGHLDATHFQSGPVESDSELWINAGRAYAVPVVISTTGTRLLWEFVTYPKVCVLQFNVCSQRV